MTDNESLLEQLRIERGESKPITTFNWLIALCGVAVLLIAIVGAIYFTRAQAVPVQFAVVEQAQSIVTGSSILDATGYVVARRQATVASKIAGKVMEVLIEEGQHVEQGQVIAKLDDTNTRAALARSQAQFQQARASLQAAQMELVNHQSIFERSQKLIASKVISADAFDNSKIAYDTALANVDVSRQALSVAKAVLQEAEVNVDDTIVRAPFAGVVTVKAVQPGEIISPISAGGGFTRTGIGTIVDMDSMELEVDVNESYVGRVRPDLPATVTLNAYPDWQIPARIIAMIPTADRNKATVRIRVGFSIKDSRILPQMGAHVSFLDETTRDQDTHAKPGVIVPAAAVQAVDGNGILFVIKNNILEKRTVQLGALKSKGYLVAAGVAAGERLAIGDWSKLSDKTEIRIIQR